MNKRADIWLLEFAEYGYAKLAIHTIVKHMEMKKTLIIPILLLIFSCSSPKAVLKTNGIEEIGTLIDSLKEGKWKTYDQGKLLDIRSCYDKNGGQLDCGRIIDGNGTLILHDVELNTDTVQRFGFVKGILKEK